jgi:hypothetical protein
MRGVDPRTAVLGLWLVFTLSVQRWPSWVEGIRVQFAADTRSYEEIARAAPSLPATHILRPFAERFPTHWSVGVISDLTGVPLHLVYRIASVVCVVLVIAVVHLALVRVGLDVRSHAVALGALAASAYPVHYLLAAPGMLSDGVFILGLSVALLGFTRERFPVAVAGLMLATIGRQTAVPVGAAASIWVFLIRDWRATRWQRAGLCVLIPAAIYAALHFVADPFASPGVGGLHDVSVLGFLTGVRPIAEHLGRVALGLAVPTALVLGAWQRSRMRLLCGPVLVAAAVALQPVVLGPASNGSNEPRLAGLAAPALVVAASTFLRKTALGLRETAVLVAAVAAAGVHHRYTHAGLQTNVEWATVELIAATVVFTILARPFRTDPPAFPDIE